MKMAFEDLQIFTKSVSFHFRQLLQRLTGGLTNWMFFSIRVAKIDFVHTMSSNVRDTHRSSINLRNNSITDNDSYNCSLQWSNIVTNALSLIGVTVGVCVTQSDSLFE